jgi:sugar O-acyltransferase (sialic acid O-acetyltransferase NeuD family)
VKNIILIGGGGHCHSAIDVIEAEGIFSIKGVFDNNKATESLVQGYPILGNDSTLFSGIAPDCYAFITIGQIKNPDKRMEIFEALLTKNFKIPTIISPRSYVSRSAEINFGTIIMHAAVVNSNVIIGNNCIINSQALIEHDSIIESHCHLATGTKINGGVYIESGCFIGSGSIIKEGIRIGKNSIVGAGSVVLKDLPENSQYIGKYT